jgi:hypothetical protein
VNQSCTALHCPHGNRRHDKPQYKVEGETVYETDAYGRVKQQKFDIKNEKSRSK